MADIIDDLGQPTGAAQPPAGDGAQPTAGGNDPFGFGTQMPAGETQPAGDGAQPPAGDGAQPPAGVPDKYTFNLPEGLSMTPELEEKFTKIAKEAGITQAQADGLVKMHADIVTGIMKQAEDQKNAWADECRKEGLCTPENLAKAKLTIDTFGGGKVMSALVDSGVVFNPDVQRFLQNIGDLIKEDNAPDGKPTMPAKNAADLLFPNSAYNK